MSPVIAAAEASGEQNPYQTFIFLGIVAVFFYLLLWRPEQRRRKKLQQLRETLKVGDRVTAMGIVGTVDAINEATIVVKNVDGSKIEMIKAAITEVQAQATSVSQDGGEPSK